VLRCAAYECSTARKAESVFQKRFQITLEDLEDLYGHPGWKGSPFGGNQWLEVARFVIRLRDALETGDAGAQTELLEQISSLRHNTGSLKSKLQTLDASLKGPPNCDGQSSALGGGTDTRGAIVAAKPETATLRRRARVL
jgi:hypothetical protein